MGWGSRSGKAHPWRPQPWPATVHAEVFISWGKAHLCCASPLASLKTGCRAMASWVLTHLDLSHALSFQECGRWQGQVFCPCVEECMYSQGCGWSMCLGWWEYPSPVEVGSAEDKSVCLSSCVRCCLDIDLRGVDPRGCVGVCELGERAQVYSARMQECWRVRLLRWGRASYWGQSI